MTQAYKFPPGTLVRLLADDQGPPGARPVPKGEAIRIGRLDGMYCNSTDLQGQPVYIKAWTEVELAE